MLHLPELWPRLGQLEAPGDRGAVVATCIGNALERQIQNLRRAAAIAP
jgi:hypothetical protein